VSTGAARPALGRTGGGYWVTGADGRVFASGSVTFQGSLTGLPLAQPVIGILSSPRRPAPSCSYVVAP
jgi:hypothetical protein